VLVEGRPIVDFDNVEHPLDSEHLAAVLTSTTWEDRILGRTAIVRLPQRAVWIATGNNVRLGRDMVRRVYWIRLDALVARPWQRENFRHPDLLNWVDSNRPNLLASLLTLARSWFAAGCPPAKVAAFGSFEDWARIIGGVLAHIGVETFLGNLEALYDSADEEEAQWAAFLPALEERFGQEPFTITRLCKVILDEPSSRLRESLPDSLAAVASPERRSGLSTRLGKAFAKRRNVVYGEDLRIERVGDDAHSKAALWGLRRMRRLRGSLQPPPVENGTQTIPSLDQITSASSASSATGEDPLHCRAGEALDHHVIENGPGGNGAAPAH